ncbi:coproporphyrinogen III oxidase [Vararia minispora EC-137]|uniref:Coproporphyrinogen III oxidase n=1 Tax=Vararia minispora EC-137 TaxID=1314806 RepID=A0ACB8QH52_9AGAM|nr:coproporphyrinogen III oxidase [Vararia minispora EC-137]
MASSSSVPMRERMTEYVIGLQDAIVAGLEALDPNGPKFKRDRWERTEGGFGISTVFAVPPEPEHFASSAGGPSTTPTSVIERAGVNISVIHGNLPPAGVKQMRVEHASLPYDPNSETTLPFFAAGISLIVHPRNPHAPTVHANYRYFEITARKDSETPGKVLAWWFGGGSDLTPSYFYEKDAVHFHRTIKDACDAHGSKLYSSFKPWCDEYFYLPHRGEARGIGGLFFDDFCADVHKRIPAAEGETSERPWTQEAIFAFVRAAGDAFLPSYIPVLQCRIHTPYTPSQRRWQLVRRGRYVEFNLVYDRGTKFGLMTPGARIESILVSLPETVRWEYMTDMGADPESDEGKLLAVLKKAREWV